MNSDHFVNHMSSPLIMFTVSPFSVSSLREGGRVSAGASRYAPCGAQTPHACHVHVQTLGEATHLNESGFRGEHQHFGVSECSGLFRLCLFWPTLSDKCKSVTRCVDLIHSLKSRGKLANNANGAGLSRTRTSSSLSPCERVAPFFTHSRDYEQIFYSDAFPSARSHGRGAVTYVREAFGRWDVPDISHSL